MTDDEFITSVSPRKKIIENCFYSASNLPYAHGCELATSRILKAQGSPQEWDRLPIGNGVSLGVHESQSRTWENIVGRSKAFWRFFYFKARSEN